MFFYLFIYLTCQELFRLDAMLKKKKVFTSSAEPLSSRQIQRLWHTFYMNKLKGFHWAK